MRLIDADKLRHELIMGHDLVGAKYSDLAETVEAIPICWLKAYMQYLYPEWNAICGEFAKMIKAWEEENGRKEQ